MGWLLPAAFLPISRLQRGSRFCRPHYYCSAVPHAAQIVIPLWTRSPLSGEAPVEYVFDLLADGTGLRCVVQQSTHQRQTCLLA